MQEPARAVGQILQVALVAPYPTVRAGLRALLAFERSIEVGAEAASVRDLVAEERTAFGVVIIDVDVDGLWGAVADFAALPKDAGVVLLGPEPWETGFLDSLGERAFAYLLKDAGGPELARAVEGVAAGLVVIQPPLTRRLLAPAALETVDSGGATSLTPREHDVLQLVAQGLPNKVIALRLGISEHTVKFHVPSILGKLGASSRSEAVRLGARRGLVVL
jgi:two-component system nitrate/nitrite response regulator NarL